MFAREDPRLLRLFPVHPEDVHLVVEEHLELLEGDHRACLHLHPFDLQGTYIAITIHCTQLQVSLRATQTMYINRF